MPWPMKNKGNQRQRLAPPQRNIRLSQRPLNFRALAPVFFGSPNLHLVVERSLAGTVVRCISSDQLQDAHLRLSLELEQIIQRLTRNVFAEHDERRDVAAIDSLNP